MSDLEKEEGQGYADYEILDYYDSVNDLEIECFKDKTFVSVELVDEDYHTRFGEHLRFVTSNGEIFILGHRQDCCENVYLESVVGDLSDLVGTPILKAEEVVSDEDPEDFTWEKPERWDWMDDEDYEIECRSARESFTWTFYKLATAKGYVDLRWYGTSNGYYSETAELFQLVKQQQD